MLNRILLTITAYYNAVDAAKYSYVCTWMGQAPRLQLIATTTFFIVFTTDVDDC